MGYINHFPALPQVPTSLLRCLALAVLVTETPPIQAHTEPDTTRHNPETHWPVPAEPQQLFYLQRDPDINTVVYQLNMKNGQIDENDPVNVFWIRYTENQEQKPLNYIQRTMAFGVSHEKLENGDYALRLVSYKDLPLRLSYHQGERNYRVYTKIQGAQAILDRIYVRIDGGSVFSPNIVYFELSGRDAATGRAVSERITP